MRATVRKQGDFAVLLIDYSLISSFDCALIFVAFENRENSWKSPIISESVKNKSKTGAINCVAVISNC